MRRTRTLTSGQAILLWLGINVAATPALAWTPKEAMPSQPVVLIAGLSSRSEEVQELNLAAAAQLSDLNVEVQATTLDELPAEPAELLAELIVVASRHDADLVFFLDPAGGHRVMLLLAEESETSLFARDLGGLGEGGFIEAASLVLRAAVQGGLRDPSATFEIIARSVDSEIPRTPEVRVEPLSPRVGPDEEEPAGTASTVTSPLAAPSRLAISLGYQVEGWLEAPTVAHGLALSLQARLWRGLWAQLGYLFTFRLEHDDRVLVALDRHPLWLGLGYLHPLGRVELGGTVSVAIDIVSESFTAEAPLEPQPNNVFLDWSVGASFDLTVAISRSVGVFFSMGIWLPMRRPEYAIQSDTSEEVVLRTLVVRPHALLGFWARFL